MTLTEQQNAALAIATEINNQIGGESQSDIQAVISLVYDDLDNIPGFSMTTFGAALDAEGVSVSHEQNDTMGTDGICRRKTPA